MRASGRGAKAALVARRAASRLPRSIKRPLQAIFGRAKRAWLYELRWPAPLWRITGRAWLELEGNRFRFEQVSRWPTTWWARRVHDGVWEREVAAFLAKTIKPGDTVLDIGAYVGPHALLASRLAGPSGAVYAFEPDPVARELLARNLLANRAANVTILPWAVVGQPGPVWLKSDSLGNANTAVSASEGISRVPAVTLAGFCDQLRLTPDVIKIDVEGGEADIVTEDAIPVLTGARAVVIEVHQDALAERGTSAGEFISRCAKTGKAVIALEARTESNFNIALT